MEIDDADHSGNFIMLEVMNISSIGPNLQIAPGAKPGDGKLELVLLTEKHRDQLLDQVRRPDDGNTNAYPTFQGSSIQLHCEERLVHVDDELVKEVNPGPVHVEAQGGMLDFLVPLE